MAHLTGIATSPVDLLDQIRVWLLTRGWAQNRWQSWSDANRYDLCMSKGSTYLNFRSYSDGVVPWDGNYVLGWGILFFVGTAYDSGTDTVRQAGGPQYSDGGTIGIASNLGSGPFASHQFFDDEAGNYLLMIERSPGVWRHICWGDSLDKSGAGSWVGGAYFSGHKNNRYHGSNVDGGGAVGNFPPMPNSDNNGVRAYVRADVDTFTNGWIGLTYFPSFASQSTSPATGKFGCDAHVCDWACDWTEPPKYGAYFNGRLFNTQDQRAILQPLMIFAKRDAGGLSLLGTVPSLAISSSGAALATGQDLTVGSEVWRQFPGFLVRVVG